MRFGDPETQALLVRMESDLVPLLDGAARGSLDPSQAVDWGDAAVCVVMASAGYPRAYEKGKRIGGLETCAGDKDVEVFHAGTRSAPDGAIRTSGGRVLGVTARGVDVREARDRAYAAVRQIQFDGAHYRSDIALRALER